MNRARLLWFAVFVGSIIALLSVGYWFARIAVVYALYKLMRFAWKKFKTEV